MTVQKQINDYIAAQPEPKRSEMRQLHRMIAALMPGCKLWFLDGKDEKGKIVSNPNIGYGSRTVEYANGKTREFYQIGVSANTTGISVYILGLEDKQYLARTFGPDLGKASVTGYCIKFKTLAGINLDILKAAIQSGIGSASRRSAPADSRKRASMKSQQAALTKPSEPEKVDAFIRALTHHLANVVVALRKIILSTAPEIGEEIKWNAPAFFFAGSMKPFNPKEYKRHIAVFNLHQKDCVRLVFPSGARVNDTSGLMEGDYADGRRLALFHNMEEVKRKQAQLQSVIRTWLKTLEKQ